MMCKTVVIKIKLIIRSNLSRNVPFVVGDLSALCTVLSFEGECPIAARKQEKIGFTAFYKTLEYLDCGFLNMNVIKVKVLILVK